MKFLLFLLFLTVLCSVIEDNFESFDTNKDGKIDKDELQNKLKAMEVLRARLLDRRVEEQERERARMRRTQVGTGDRSQKIRTYNFPQSRVTDHRIGFTSHNLPAILNGDIRPMIEALRMADVEEQLDE